MALPLLLPHALVQTHQPEAGGAAVHLFLSRVVPAGDALTIVCDADFDPGLTVMESDGDLRGATVTQGVAQALVGGFVKLQACIG